MYPKNTTQPMVSWMDVEKPMNGGSFQVFPNDWEYIHFWILNLFSNWLFLLTN